MNNKIKNKIYILLIFNISILQTDQELIPMEYTMQNTWKKCKNASNKENKKGILGIK